MLVALNKHNKKVLSYDACKQENYHCPTCKQEVILKKGAIKTPHFAHKSVTSCDSYSEAESAEHLAGKYLLAKNCELFGLAYELEYYIPSINQRADLMIEGHIAIEFQCSSLSIERLRERTKAYQAHGYVVFWVLGGKLKEVRQMTELKKQLLYFNDKDSYYHMELDVLQKKFLIRRYLTKLNHKVEQQLLSYSLVEYSCLKLVTRQTPVVKYGISYDFSLDKLVRLQLRWHKQLYLKQTQLLSIQEALYNLQANIMALPVYVYLPSISHPFIGEWEYVLRFIVSEHLRKLGSLSYKGLFSHCLSEMKKVASLDFICLQSYQVVDYCLSLYLVFLQQASLVKKEGEVYRWQKAMSDDTCLLENYLKKKVEFLSLPLKYDMIDK